MQMEIPENVLSAIVAFVEHFRGSKCLSDDFIEHDLPVLCAWLDELELLPPLFTEA